MRTRTFCAFLLTLSAFTPLKAAEKLQESRIFPILAWGGPPADQTNVKRYRELADAGFTHNYSGASNLDGAHKMLQVAQQTGIKVVLSTPELQADPETTARKVKDHAALGGYFLRDEPGASLFPELATWVKRIQSVDPAHPCYINLFPNYANAEQLQVPSYDQYVRRYVAEVPVPVISFDHYPVIGPAAVRGEWYQNLEIVSEASRKADKPMWGFCLAVAHDPYPVAQLQHLRLQAFSNLAYGAQAIQYFTYWTMKSDTWNFHEGPVGLDGKRTAVYNRVKQVNQEIQGLRPVFLGAKVLSIGHTDPIPAGTRPFQPVGPVKSLQSGGDGALISHLEKGDRQFLAIVNRSLARELPLKVTLHTMNGIDRVEKTGEVHPMTGAIHTAGLPPGDVFILSWRK